MKRISIILATLSVVALCSFVSYRAGFAHAKQLQKGTFIASLESLEKLRAGDFMEATRKMESLCFSSANMIYGDPAYHNELVTRTFAPELIQYRAIYRTNHADWTATEEQLDTHLASWR